MTYAAACLALAIVLPFLTGQMPQLGQMFCPMHIPALLCGFTAGPWWGLAVGFIAPLLRHLLLSAPPYPTCLSMAFELAVYGFTAGMLYKKLPGKKRSIWIALISAMLLGRVAAGVSMAILMGLSGMKYTMKAFISVNLITAIPAILIQLLLIPPIVSLLEKAGIAHRHHR